MTVHELFNSLTFDDVLDALRNTHRNEPSIRNVAGYKMAFDYICHLQPQTENEQVTFDVTPRENWFETHGLPLIANNVEGDYWENTVGKDVVKPGNNPFSDTELAGAILWGMTFYGFTDNEKMFGRDDVYSEYGIRAQCLQRHQYLPYLRDKNLIRNLKKPSGIFKSYDGIAFTMGIWKQINHRKSHQNRSKRKRYYRIEQRIERLQLIDRRIGLINRINMQVGEEMGSQLESKILNAKAITEHFRESRAYGKMSRVDYLKQLIGNYDPLLWDDTKGCISVVVIASSSTHSPISQEEETLLYEFLSQKFSDYSLKCQLESFFNHEDESSEITLQILLFNENKKDGSKRKSGRY